MCRGDQDNWGQECNKVCNKIKDSISNLEEHVVVNKNRDQFQEMFQYGTGKSNASIQEHFNEWNKDCPEDNEILIKISKHYFFLFFRFRHIHPLITCIISSVKGWKLDYFIL